MTPHERDQASRDKEMNAWLEHALGAREPDPIPVLHDLDD